MPDVSLIIIGVIACGIVAIAVVAYLWFIPSGQEKVVRKASAMVAGATKARVGVVLAANDDTAARRKQVQESLKKIDEQQKRLEDRKKVSFEQRLEQAGLTTNTRQFCTIAFVLGLVFGAVGFLSGQQFYVIIAMFVVGTFGVPLWVLGFLTKRRQKKFINEFANAVDVIIRGVQSGLPVNECLNIIARDGEQPVREEFQQLTEGLRIGLGLEQGLERMYERMPLTEVNFFGIVLVIQKQSGGNLAEALGNLSSVLRGRKLMEGKISALSTEAKASAVILGSLPFVVSLLVQLASPTYLLPLFEDKLGNFLLIGAGVWMLIGIIVMKQMISIKV